MFGAEMQRSKPEDCPLQLCREELDEESLKDYERISRAARSPELNTNCRPWDATTQCWPSHDSPTYIFSPEPTRKILQNLDVRQETSVLTARQGLHAWGAAARSAASPSRNFAHPCFLHQNSPTFRSTCRKWSDSTCDVYEEKQERIDKKPAEPEGVREIRGRGRKFGIDAALQERVL